MTVLRLVADDLTGALDAAAQFTGRMGPLPVLLDRTIAAPEGSYIVDLACRDRDERTAVAYTHESLRSFSGAGLAFKKIDSLLRGHWAAELAEIVRFGAFRRIVLAPAFPGQGRLTRGGRQMIVQSSTEPVLVKDISAELKHQIASSRDGECGVILLDAESDADLSAIAERYAHEPAILWCGAAGLAKALAHLPPRIAAPLAPQHLVVVGSRHPVSLLQVEVAARARSDWFVPLTPEHSFVERAQGTLESCGRCIVLPALTSGLSEIEVAARIASGAERLAARLPRLGALTVVGGETFAAICRALKATWLRVEGEFQSGVPASCMQSGIWQGTLCASKSGAFGEPDWLMKHLGPWS